MQTWRELGIDIPTGATGEVRTICEPGYAEVVVPPDRYNALYEQFRREGKNLNTLLAWGHVRAIQTVREFPDDQFLLFVTLKGTVKKTALSQYSNVRANGIKAIKIEGGDELIDVQVTTGTNDIVLATRHGLSI